MPSRYPPIPVNELGALWDYGLEETTLVRKAQPKWFAPQITSAGRIARCCGSSAYSFNYEVPLKSASYHTVADEHIGKRPGDGSVVFKREYVDQKEYEAWLHEWLKAWHAYRSGRTYMLATLMENQVRAWMPFLEPHGWRIVAKHVNGNTKNMLYIIVRTNTKGTEIGKA